MIVILNELRIVLQIIKETKSSRFWPWILAQKTSLGQSGVESSVLIECAKRIKEMAIEIQQIEARSWGGQQEMAK